ncbi:MAG: hypothetical protein WBF97_07800 [Comamonas sp.]
MATIAGCGTSTLKSGEQASEVRSRIVESNLHGFNEYYSIGKINGNRQWPASSYAKITPGPTSVILFGEKTKMGAVYREGETYKFQAHPGRRYDLYRGGIILSSDATKEDKNGLLKKTAMISSSIGGALIQSATTITGEDATNYIDKIAPRLSFIHQYYGSDDGYYTTPGLQLAREAVEGKRTITGRLVGFNYLTVPAGKTISIAMKQCDDCKIFALYKITPENGKRYELAPSGKIYISDAYNDDILNSRTILK